MTTYFQNLKMLRGNLIGFALGLALLTFISVMFLPTLQSQGANFSKMMESLPKGMLAAFGVKDVADMMSPQGFLQGRLFGLMVPVLLIIQGIGIGAGILAGEEERGQLEVVMSYPISRIKIFSEKLAVLFTGLALSSAATFVSMVVGLKLVNIALPTGLLAAATFSAFALACLFGFLAYGVGASKGRRGLALGAVSGFAAFAYLWNVLSPLSQDTASLQKFSPFYLGGGYEPIKEGLNPGYTLILLGLALVAILIGFYKFNRRDLGV